MRSSNKTLFYTEPVEKAIIVSVSIAAGAATVFAAIEVFALPVVSISAGFVATLSATILSAKVCRALALPFRSIRRSYTAMDEKTTAYASFTVGKSQLTEEFEVSTETEGPHKNLDIASSGYCVEGPTVFASETAWL